MLRKTRQRPIPGLEAPGCVASKGSEYGCRRPSPCISSPKKHPWQSFEEIFSAAHDAAVSTERRLFVGENGSVEQCDCGNSLGDPNAKAQWLADQCATLRSWPEVHAVLYSHTTCNHNGYMMKYRVDSSAEALAAYKAFGQAPQFLAAAA